MTHPIIVANAEALTRLDELQTRLARSDDHIYSKGDESVTSVTRIAKLLHSPVLEGWKLKMERERALRFAGQHPPHDDEIAEEYVVRTTRAIPKRAASEDISDRATARGQSIHAAIEAVLAGREAPSLKHGEQLMFDNWIQWWSGSSLKPLRCEFMVWSALGYAGTGDALLYDDNGLVLADWKTGRLGYPPWEEWSLQSAAYRQALAELGFGPTRGLVIQLSRDGEGYGEHWLEDDYGEAFSAFAGLLAVTRYRDVRSGLLGASRTVYTGPGVNPFEG
jgi:hypothetical protein